MRLPPAFLLRLVGPLTGSVSSTRLPRLSIGPHHWFQEPPHRKRRPGIDPEWRHEVHAGSSKRRQKLLIKKPQRIQVRTSVEEQKKVLSDVSRGARCNSRKRNQSRNSEQRLRQVKLRSNHFS